MSCQILQRSFVVITFVGFVYGCGSGSSLNNSTDTPANPINPIPANGSLLSENYGLNPTVAAAIVGDHVNVYVAWEEPFGQRPSIVFRRSTNGGNTFESPQRLFSVIPEGSNPALVASGDDVYLVWTGEGPQPGSHEILFSFSNQQGGPNSNGSHSFTFPVRVSELGKLSIHPAMAVSPLGIVYIAWLDRGSGNIFFRRAVDPGRDFEDSRNLILELSENGTATEGFSISADGNNVYSGWEDRLPHNPDDSVTHDILFVKSVNQGQSFGSSTNLSRNLTNSSRPVMTVASGTLYLAWEDFASNNSSVSSVISFIRSTDGGTNFSDPPAQLFLGGGTFTGPRIAADADRVFIAWPDRDPNTENRQVFFTELSDLGTRIHRGPINISQNPISSQNPAIAAANGQAYVVWEGQSGTGPDASQRIFFFRP